MSAVYSPALKYSRNYSDMDSRNNHIQQQQISGLLRYRSVPSSALGKMVEREGGWKGLDHQQRERRCYVPCFDAEMGGMLDSGSNNGWSNVKQEGGGRGGGSVFCNEADQLIYNSHEGFQEFAVSGSGSSVMMMMNSFQNSTQSKMASGNCSNNLLLRQKSSPTGFFSNLSLTNALGEQDTTSTSGLNGGAFTFSSETSSSYPRRMPQIAENGNDTLENQKEQEEEEEARTCVETTRLRNDKGSHHKSYMPSFTSDFCESSSFTAHKTASSDSEFLFSTSSDALESQQADQFRYQNAGLTHQMSLPSSSTKIGGIERILHIQGSVPCKIRAKRGFATHPRSIAERVRRTRISERIKKLQELFPKSDKQTNTADMLDLAVDYIKDLQKQVKILTNTRAKCRCSGVQKQ